MNINSCAPFGSKVKNVVSCRTWHFLRPAYHWQTVRTRREKRYPVPGEISRLIDEHCATDGNPLQPPAGKAPS